MNPRYPDFNYKKTQDALWLRDRRNPPWVAAELAAIAPGIVQFDSFSWNRRLVRVMLRLGTMELFKRMQLKGMRLDRFRIVIVLNTCASLHALKGGMRAQEQIMQIGLQG